MPELFLGSSEHINTIYIYILYVYKVDLYYNILLFIPLPCNHLAVKTYLRYHTLKEETENNLRFILFSRYINVVKYVTFDFFKFFIQNNL